MGGSNPRLLLIVILIFALNAFLSFWNVAEDGASALRLIPAISWSVATIIWLLYWLGKRRD